MNATKLPHDARAFPTSVPEDAQNRVSGDALRRSNEVESATGHKLDWPPRGQPDANVNTPAGGPPVER